MSPLSAIRFCLFCVLLDASTMAILCDTNGATASAEKTCPAGCSHRPAGPPTTT